jgi:NADPH:quinone reductase-like Zn-dependent oxidoreductase
MNQMKAIVYTEYGSPDVLELKELEKPMPKENAVLVSVHAATATIGDVILRKLHPLFFLPLQLFGMKRKGIPGHELAGEIEVVGKEVKRFKIGDRVFGTTTGLSVGANAQMMEATLYGPLKSRNGKQQMGNLLAQPNQKDLEQVAELLAAGKVKPVIAQRYWLSETADAIRDMEAGRAQGKIVITM